MIFVVFCWALHIFVSTHMRTHVQTCLVDIFSSLPSPACQSSRANLLRESHFSLNGFRDFNILLSFFPTYCSFLHFLTRNSRLPPFFQTVFSDGEKATQQNVWISVLICVLLLQLEQQVDSALTQLTQVGGVARLICCLPIILRVGGTAASFSRQTDGW